MTDVATDPRSASDAAAEEEFEPLYPDVGAWVDTFFAPTFVRQQSAALRWCGRWWQHPEAIIRLTALWQTWEAARVTPGGAGMADWLRGYLDPLLTELLRPDGTFAGCKTDRHTDPAPLPTVPAPADYWAPMTSEQ